jgi:hypothetical protein
MCISDFLQNNKGLLEVVNRLFSVTKGVMTYRNTEESPCL